MCVPVVLCVAVHAGESAETTEEVMGGQEPGHDGHGDGDGGAGGEAAKEGHHDDTEINNDNTAAAVVEDDATE